MADIKQFLKSQIPKLMPFVIFVVLYFIFVSNPYGELNTTLLKCAPIVALITYVFFNGTKLPEDCNYIRRIIIGLIFSCCGDALLNIDLFPQGMGAFALAQISYISAFGLKPLLLPFAVPLYLAGAALVAIVFKELDGILVVGLPVYALLLLTMCWRSLAQAVRNPNILFVFCAVGSVCFVISDGLIAADMFLFKVPFARILIMSTYYLAQFAIALSTAYGFLQPKNRKGLNNSGRQQMKLKD